jgi:5-methylcytosine-specific restriction endonuclease McrA
MVRTVTKQCEQCGGAFSRIAVWASRQRFCSRECAGAAHRARVRINVACGTCGKIDSLSPYYASTRKFCSRECADSDLRRPDLEKPCATCGKVFRPRAYAAPTAKYCSRKCAAFLRFIGCDEREADRLHANRRRARQLANGGNYTAAGWLAKCEYWGWRCYLCGVGLTKESVQLEHRIPLSRGGSNWLANLAPACKSCNSRKHAKTEAEFRALQKQGQGITLDPQPSQGGAV